MAANSEFFGAISPQAVLKHGVLTRYAHYFAGRAGSATAGRVAFVDGYAGKGRYDDGSPGSPLLLASQAKRAAFIGRDVRLAFVEQDDVRRKQLLSSLKEEGIEADQVLDGSFETAVDTLLERYKDHAIFLFVDPFGLAISRATLNRILAQRSRSQPIDVLYHFSLSAVARMGSLGVTKQQGWKHSADKLDVALGIDTWRDAFRASTGEEGSATQAAIQTARTFAAAIEADTSTKTTSIPVRQRPGQRPKYLLTLFSANQAAHWDFADIAGSAHVDWLHHCDNDDFEANLRESENQGLMSLFPAEAPRRDNIEERFKTQAASFFDDHLPSLLPAMGSVRPLDSFEALYGDMLGQARATHLRNALKRQHEAGHLDDDCKGDGWTRRSLRWIPAI